MTRISFTSKRDALLRCKNLLVVGSPGVFERRKLSRILPGGPLDTLAELAKDVSPGLLGSSAGSLTGDTPRRAIAGLLPEKVSRHNSPSRAESVRRLVAGAGLGASEASDGVLLVLDDAAHVTAAVNAVGRAFPLYSVKSGNSKPGKVTIGAVTKGGKDVAIPVDAKRTLEAGREAARLVDTPPTEMDPAAMVREAKKLLRGIKNVKVSVIVGDDLLRNKLGGIHGVGRTALSAPRLLVATYSPPGAKGESVALVGKGVTYDTGGLNIKISGNMSNMKSDMGGSAAVLGAFRVLAQSRIKRKVHLLMGLVENAVGPRSYKPDDVLYMHSGKTVEINNTDAEGRLVLADGCSWAARKLKADVIFDAATLTGAQLVATGLLHAGVMSNDEKLERLTVEAGRASGDLAHALPFAPEFYKAEFESKIADMRNSVKNRMNAQTSCAGQFIYNHIEDTEARWCHVDLAGPAFPAGRGTGFGVALLAEAVRRLG